MPRPVPKFAALLFLAATLGSGWLHGRFVDRWGQPGELKDAAAKLGRELPLRLGPWRLVKTLELDADVKKTLRCTAHLHGIYTSDQTGDTVEVAVLAGPSGPLSVHTPEICFAANDYELAAERRQQTISDAHGQSHTLWQIHANSRHATRPNLRILYAWSRGSNWEAVRGPRFALAGLPMIYKLQLAGPALDQPSDARGDPCHDFLSRFLVEIQPRLVTVAGKETSP